jgi:hypothetical protein
MQTIVESQIARSGVDVLVETLPKYPASGKPVLEYQAPLIQVDTEKRTMITTECVYSPGRCLQGSLNNKECRETYKHPNNEGASFTTSQVQYLERITKASVKKASNMIDSPTYLKESGTGWTGKVFSMTKPISVI